MLLQIKKEAQRFTGVSITYNVIKGQLSHDDILSFGQIMGLY
jgi:hypothetical protein